MYNITNDAAALLLTGIICLIISAILYFLNINSWALIGWGLCDISIGIKYRNYVFLRMDKYNILNVEYKDR